MRIRFQADADLRVPIINGLKRREPSVDFMTAREAGLTGLEDSAVLVLAASNGRVLVWSSTQAEDWRNVLSFLPR